MRENGRTPIASIALLLFDLFTTLSLLREFLEFLLKGEILHAIRRMSQVSLIKGKCLRVSATVVICHTWMKRLTVLSRIWNVWERTTICSRDDIGNTRQINAWLLIITATTELLNYIYAHYHGYILKRISRENSSNLSPKLFLFYFLLIVCNF